LTTSRFAGLTRDQLATLVPELLLIGQLIDRSGMAWCIREFGREEMLRIAIEEWAGCSPVYTKRMQKALRYEGVDVITIFKGLQLDIGAPPQFMDFRYTVHDRWHGEFHLDFCGALMDVEPMGEDYVRGMCHDIEDPTFDATAVATNPKARVRPIHRPPRVPADQHPHCRWTVTIDESYPPVSGIPAASPEGNERTALGRAGRWRATRVCVCTAAVVAVGHHLPGRTDVPVGRSYAARSRLAGLLVQRGYFCCRHVLALRQHPHFW